MKKEELTTQEKLFILRAIDKYEKWLEEHWFYSNQEIPEAIKIEKKMIISEIKRKLQEKHNNKIYFKPTP